MDGEESSPASCTSEENASALTAGVSSDSTRSTMKHSTSSASSGTPWGGTPRSDMRVPCPWSPAELSRPWVNIRPETSRAVVVYPCVSEDRSTDVGPCGRRGSCRRDCGFHWSIRLAGGGSRRHRGGAGRPRGAATRHRTGNSPLPLRLPPHSAHTPLMHATADRAATESVTSCRHLRSRSLMDSDVCFVPTSPPRIDGHARRPSHRDIRPDEGPPNRAAYGRSRCHPSRPRKQPRQAVAQAIMERWSGIDNRDAFITRQNQDPILLSMRWPDQRARVVGS